MNGEETERVSPKREKVCAAVLTALFAIPSLLLVLILFSGQKTVSVSENRSLAVFPPLTLSGFAAGTFQTQFQDAVADQYPFSDGIRDAVAGAEQAVHGAEQRLLGMLLPVSERLYSAVAEGYYHFDGDEHRIVERPAPDAAQIYDFSTAAEWFNSLEGVEKYVYLVRNSRVQDFTLTEEENDAVYRRIRDEFAADGYGCFRAADYEAYCELFYQTDHHWNHAGADRGYREICALLGIGEEEMIPVGEEITYDCVFNGSYAKQAQLNCADEKFTVIGYDLPRFRITLDGKKSTAYGNRKQYESGKYSKDENANHYALYYGGDYGEIVIDSGREDGKDLLLIADSYSNPVNLLIASHFAKTHVIDLRYYEEYAKKPFDAAEYVRENGIDVVLLAGDVSLFGAKTEGGTP